MEALANAAVSSPLFQINATATKKLQLKARTLHCFSKNGNGASFSAEPSHVDLEVQNTRTAQEPVVSTSGRSEMNHQEIWKLFKDAQKSKASEKIL